MSCQGCAGAGCLENYELEDVDLYSLQGDPFLYVIDCPPGFDCKGQGGPISMQCCDEVITLILPPFPTDAQFQAVVAALVSACAARVPFCSEGGPNPPPNPKPKPGPNPFPQPNPGPDPGDGGPLLPGHPKVLYFNHPETCRVRCSDGAVFAYTTPPGRFVGLAQIAADAAAWRFACASAVQHRICLSNLPAQWCSETPFTKTITATGAFLATFPQADFWEVSSGTVPTGVTFNGGYIVGGVASFSGTPTTPGSYTFTISVTDPSGDMQSKTYTICIVGIQNSDPLPDATQGTPYSQTLTAPSCAVAPLSWQVTSGELPPGLTLDEEMGVISGTPTAAASFVFTVTLQTQST